MHISAFNRYNRNGLKPATRWICLLLLVLGLGMAGRVFAESGDNAGETSITSTMEESPVEEGMEHHSPAALEVYNLGRFPVTNSMITGWLVTIILAVVAIRFRNQVRAGRRTLFTATVETIVLGLHGFLSDIMGAKLAKDTLWLLGSFFIFIVSANLLGLIPGIGCIGWGYQSGHLFTVTTPLFRGVNADLNTTLALGALFFVFWLFWAWKANGAIGILKHIFGFQGEATGIMHVVMAIVFLAVGLLELLSILIRPFSLALRLYGNIFAGEVVLNTMHHKVPLLSWLLPVPFYLMEVLVGLIQAMVFTLLSAVFVMLICRHDEEEHVHLEVDEEVSETN